ncbi:MAG: phenylacetate--CoA ligase family protein [Actinobacteria bacterium]|nr:phenylacetate--CoA ligase family protein [Actinomycetota bacterium]
MQGVAERVYAALPVPLQHTGVSAYGYMWRHRRMGGKFQAYRRGFVAREGFTSDQWEAWQTNRLREMISLAAEAPAYRRVFGEIGLARLDLDRFKLEDLERLPILDKDQVRQDPRSFCPGGAPSLEARPYHTSGSTGTPITVYHSGSDLRRWYALVDARYQTVVGITYGMPRATFSGRRVEVDPDSSGPYYRFNRAEEQVYFSAYHLGPSTVESYVEALWRHRPKWLTGYAGAIHELARLALEHGPECPPLAAVVTSAEPVTPRLREDVSRVFGCDVTEEYGLIEGVCHVLECAEGSLHSSPDAGIVEVVGEDGRPCEPGEVGEIVATGLVHQSQILLRYRTGDLGSWADGACPCGRHMPILRGIEGRVEDVVLKPDGSRVGRLTSVARDLPGVVAMQFVQEGPGELTGRVIFDGELPDDIRSEILRRLGDRIGNSMSIAVEQVEHLERTPRGKVRGVINRVDSQGPTAKAA